jgi:hypothetical protein
MLAITPFSDFVGVIEIETGICREIFNDGAGAELLRNTVMVVHGCSPSGRLRKV